MQMCGLAIVKEIFRVFPNSVTVFPSVAKSKYFCCQEIRHKLQLLSTIVLKTPVPERTPEVWEKNLVYKSIVFSLVALDNDDERQRALSRPRRSRGSLLQ